VCGKIKERFLELCEEAANEQDSEKLKAMIEGYCSASFFPKDITPSRRRRDRR
jgi:hypothetical protein